MTNELIHVKFERDEAILAKEDLLLTEIECLRVMKNIKKYRFLRTKELKIKARLKTRIGGTITKIKKLRTTLPKVKTPQIIKKIKESEIPKQDDKIELELKQIQEKLNALQLE